ncbi:MAG: choice-of-anchor Q domain-containing protein [Pseudomonadota bacterium]
MKNYRCSLLTLIQSLLLARTVVFWLCLSITSFAHAATFTVDRLDDTAAATACDDLQANDCSLRGAISKANGLSEASTINVPAGVYVLIQSSTCTYKLKNTGTIQFTSSEIPLCLSKQVTILGAGATSTIIDGNQRGRVLFVSADAVAEIRGVTIKNGLGDRSFGLIPNGGGINNQGTLTLIESLVSNNSMDPFAQAARGAGIYNAGVLTLLASTVSYNAAAVNNDSVGDGGGICNDSQAILTVSDSTIDNNTIGGNGGGIVNMEGIITVTNSTISGNTATGYSGGGIANLGGNFTGTLTVINSTISGNTSGSSGGGIYSNVQTDMHLNNVTITNNTGAAAFRGSGGGVGNNGGLFTLQNSLIAGNRDALSADNTDFTLGTQLVSRGYNLIGNIGGSIIAGDITGDITGIDPKLGVLTDNGGVTQTHALSVGSPAIDAGNPAAPGSGGVACAASDQRGFLRPLGRAGDIGAFERSGELSLAKVLPNAGGGGSVSTLISGNGFVSGATVKLAKAGQPDIAGNPVRGDTGGSAIAATFELFGVLKGPWDVVVTNPNGSSKTLPAAFTIEETRPPHLWVEIVGQSTVRLGGSGKFTVIYGNRGNVDALAVPLSISTSGGYGFGRVFDMTPPPHQTGQIAVNWKQISVVVEADAQKSFTNVPLLLPVVPAGFTGALQFVLSFPPLAQAGEFFASTGSPYFNPTLTPQIVSGLAAGAQAYAPRGIGVTIPTTLLPAIEQYVTNQLRLVVDNGRNAWVTNLGSSPQVYSLAQLQIDAAFFGAKLALTNGLASVKPKGAPNWLSTVYPLFGSLVSLLVPTAEAVDCPIVICNPKGKGEGTVTPGCSESCAKPNEDGLPPPIPAPPGCDPEKIREQLKSFGGTVKLLTSPPDCQLTQDHCAALPGYTLVKFPGGGSGCIETNCGKVFTTPSGKTVTDDCKRLPVKPINSGDPNDKSGSLGVAAAQFVVDKTPLPYTIHFENLKTATAPAQEVVITDQLDVRTMNLDSFSLGPMSFGDVTLTPPPGVNQYTGGADLRPEQNLIVVVRANLDKDTGLLTWRFSSIDPDTGQFTEDPVAGFLPPNVEPPKGEASVVFTVEPKPGLTTGTGICNEASIVFDVNDPIITPRWCNALDNAKPQSQVLPLAASQSSPIFLVQWTGTDADSGVSAYSVFVSVDNGPFTPFQTDTLSTSATFTGQTGKTYRFYSVARDFVGNTEDPPALFDTGTTIAAAGNAGDLNNDGAVNCADLAIVKASFGKRTGQPGFDPRADVNKDGVVDIRDLSFVSRLLPAGTKCS